MVKGAFLHNADGQWAPKFDADGRRKWRPIMPSWIGCDAKSALQAELTPIAADGYMNGK